MAKICFVSYEIHPAVKGGCGVLLYNTARVLLPQGHEIIFLLDIPDQEFKQFNEVDRLKLPDSEHCRAYQVSALTQNMPVRPEDFLSIFEFRAYRFYQATREINRLESPDIIEFFDYCGVAYFALTAKACGLDFENSHLAIRLHGALELIDRQQPGTLHGIDRYLMYGLEHQALRLAETVLAPSIGFYEKAYLPFYEPWEGEVIVSKPALVDIPRSTDAAPQRNVVLFYGRLHGIKGVDLFVDAALLYLKDPRNPTRQFYLVGYDSHHPPVTAGSYQSYLLRKIPAPYQRYFIFTGQLSWKELGELLPQVLFAVFPSYFESFCYAAHELYAAGIPLILSDIPAFQDYFHHEQNGLISTATVSDLAHQMTRLSLDEELRGKITHPYSLTDNPLGDFYAQPENLSWMVDRKPGTGLSLLVCVLCEQNQAPPAVLNLLRGLDRDGLRVVVARQVITQDEAAEMTWFLGKLVSFEDQNGNALAPSSLLTRQALLVVEAGDVIEPGFFETGLTALQNLPQLTFVGSWKVVQDGDRRSLETAPFDATPELLPVITKTPHSRYILRTQPGSLLMDLFDVRAGKLGELAYIWKGCDDAHFGLIIPRPLVSYTLRDAIDLSSNELDYLYLWDDQNRMQSRLARLLLSFADRAKVLQNLAQLEGNDSTLGTSSGFMRWLRSSFLYTWFSRMPWLKRTLQRGASVIRK
jgi:glycosyltransferase involved in cell wall biosynthesis